jgi:hypothetical protein
MQDESERFDAPSRRVATVGGGAPSYRVGRKGLKIIEELSARGVAEATIAKALRMGKDAFRAAKRRDPAVQEAIDRGRAVEHDRLVGVLHEQAMAGQYVPAMFLLKARHGYRRAMRLRPTLMSASTPAVSCWCPLDRVWRNSCLNTARPERMRAPSASARLGVSLADYPQVTLSTIKQMHSAREARQTHRAK